MNRHAIRVLIVRVLYEIDIKKIELFEENNLLEIINFAFDPTNEEYFLKNDDSSYQEIKNTLLNLLDNKESIDLIISKNMENYTLDRLNYVDRQIIRLAVYEMIYTDIAKNIIINEAVEISKEYTNLDDGLQSKFNNKLLDKIAQGIKK